MAKDPAFLFYSADFMMGAMVLTMEQRGQYITLLSVMHQRGRLTQDEVQFLIGGPPSGSLAKKFKIDDDGNWYNERLEAEMTKRAEFTKSRRKSLEIDNGDMVHLYLISDPQTKTIKIGSSKYPELRLKEVQKYKPGACFVWVSDSLFERVNEKHLHDRFTDKRKRYDWFSLSKEDIETIRTEYNSPHRTDTRTVNENEIVNEIKDSIKKEPKKDSSESLPGERVWGDEVYRISLTRMARDHAVPDVENLRDRWEGWYMNKFEWRKKDLQDMRKSFEGWIKDPKSRQILPNGKAFNKNDRTEFNQNELAIITAHASSGSGAQEP